jgi:hypothetical protein
MKHSFALMRWQRGPGYLIKNHLLDFSPQDPD